jgi:hypothetical protein
MTKKHFEAAAAYVRYLRNTRFAGRNVAGTAGISQAVEDAFVDVFRQFNPRFDVDRFRAACRGQDARDSAGPTVRYGVRS